MTPVIFRGDYHSIQDGYLQGIEELVEKEKRLLTSKDCYPPDSDINPESSPTEISQYREFQSEEREIVSDFVNNKLPSLIRGGALITLFSIFESNIKYISGLILRYSNININYNELSGKYLDKLKIIFKVVNNRITQENEIFELDQSIFIKNPYQLISQAQRIRNCYAHNNGFIANEEQKKQIAQAIKRLNRNQPVKYFELNGDLISIENGALNILATTMREFLQSIIKMQ